MALTATATPSLLEDLKDNLHLKKNCKVVAVNPNRNNIFLVKKVRLSDHKQLESYDEILKPIANELLIQTEDYPMTIIYMKLKYCAHAYRLFERVLQDKQFLGETMEPTARLFAQFHAPQTNRMKKELIAEIKKENSRVRVVFATSALGMGVDAPFVTQVIHISPPSNLESYMQEIGRAGRTGLQSYATLYYNKSDIGNNKKHIEESMKNYCRSEDTCLRQQLLDYFGFSITKQSKCCSVCDGEYGNAVGTINIVKKVRCLLDEDTVLKSLINMVLSDYQTESTSDCSLLHSMSIDKDLADNIVKQVEYIETESDLLNSFGIWDEVCSSKIFALISEHTLMCDEILTQEQDLF